VNWGSLDRRILTFC
jgi:hypothetical protein